MKKSNGWDHLGVVDTIYEETEEPTPSPSPSSPSSTPLDSIVEEWCLHNGRRRSTDSIIRVHSSVFHLHQEALTANSGYLRRLLKGSSEVTLAPPLKITAETFATVAEFCYGGEVAVTPWNVAAVRTAAELLEMGGSGGRDLREAAESYFRHAVAANRETATAVLRSAVALLPESEQAAALVSRSLEALSTMEGEGDDVIADVIAEVRRASPEEFRVVADSMRSRCDDDDHGHDLLYGVVHLYLQGRGEQETTEEERIRICNTIDCTKLTPHLLMHAVRNPKMPLRFLVRAMMAEQLTARRSTVSSRADPLPHTQQPVSSSRTDPLHLTRPVARHDPAVLEAAELKAAMDATSSRIKSLERELVAMKNMIKSHDHHHNIARVDPVSTKVDSSWIRVDPVSTKVPPGSTRVDPVSTKVHPKLTKVNSGLIRVDPGSIRIDPETTKVDLGWTGVDPDWTGVDPGIIADRGSTRSASFRVVGSTNRVERGQRGSMSSIGDRYLLEKERSKRTGVVDRTEKKIGWKLFNRIKHMFEKKSRDQVKGCT